MAKIRVRARQSVKQFGGKEKSEVKVRGENRKLKVGSSSRQKHGWLALRATFCSDRNAADQDPCSLDWRGTAYVATAHDIARSGRHNTENNFLAS
jgi:hypothetical protein